MHVLFDPNARVPYDTVTKKPIVDRAQERIDHLVQTMSQRQDKIIIPAPALSEFMFLAADRRIEYLAIIRRKSVFEIGGFDDPEAVELVEYSLKISPNKKLKARSPETWAKLNYDRQIIAIAITHRVEAIYSMDNGVHNLALQVGIRSYELADLPIPPPVQMKLMEDDGKKPDAGHAEEAPAPPPSPSPKEKEKH